MNTMPKEMCLECGEPKEQMNKSKCNRCLKINSDCAIRTRNKRIAQGLCHKCGKREPVRGKKICRVCSEKINLYARNSGCGKKYHKKSSQRDKAEIFEHYGGMKCSCRGCDVTAPSILTIDHIKNNGAEERDRIGKGNRAKALGIHFYRWLRKNGYPEGYRVLCMNCNCGRFRNNGICPIHGDN